MTEPFERYAIFCVPPPDADWARFCTGWLGRDIETGRDVAAPALPALPMPLAEITAAPRRYGLHATIKAPFRLTAGVAPAELGPALGAICASHGPVSLPRLALTRIGGFLALCSISAPPELAALHGAVLRGMDGFRAPLTPAEIARRGAARLTPRQRAHLARWGYPHVLEDFRFHLTLTGRLRRAELAAIGTVLERVLAPLLPDPFEIADLALAGEDALGDFHLLSRHRLSG